MWYTIAMRKKCIFCGCESIRQPAVPTLLNIITQTFPPYKVEVPICEYHHKLYNDWCTPEELAVMNRIKRTYLRKEQSYEDYKGLQANHL